MLQRKKIALIIPIYNEAKDIQDVIFSIPVYVDYIIIVNDASTDDSRNIVMSSVKQLKDRETHFIEVLDCFSGLYDVINTINKNVVNFFLINHTINLGKGAGIKSGYSFALNLDADCIATMDGDGQMDPNELINICDPILTSNVDYTKGNRLEHPDARNIIPIVRLMGIYILTNLTRLCSGYWHINDTQSGYTAISSNTLKKINFMSLYDKYGYVNDMIIKLSLINAKIKDVPISPIYKSDRISKMNVWIAIPRISFLMFKLYVFKINYRLRNCLKLV